jgi:hypothetical protein
MSRQKQENPPRVISTHIRPRFARLATAIDYSGVCRSKLYIAAAGCQDQATAGKEVENRGCVMSITCTLNLT